MKIFYIIKYGIRDAYYNIKWFFQRGFKGYCDRDLFDVQGWFVTIIPKMLREFSENLHGWPDYYFETFEEWQDCLKRMAILCERGSMDYFLDNAEKDSFEYTLEEYEKADREAEKNKDMFFEMFSKYFYNL